MKWFLLEKTIVIYNRMLAKDHLTQQTGRHCFSEQNIKEEQAMLLDMEKGNYWNKSNKK